MICPNCKKQIPDNSDSCIYCQSKINHKEHIVTEIKLRRYQRWFFYALISVLFIGCILAIVKVYKDNQDLLEKGKNITITLQKTEEALNVNKTENKKLLDDLTRKKEEIKKITQSFNESTQELDNKEKELKQKADEYLQIFNNNEELKKELEEKGEVEQNVSECKSELNNTLSDISSLVVKLGTGITNENLQKIQVADSNLLNGNDTDSDGISDALEISIGTNVEVADTDGDGFSDKDEILTGYNPLEADSKLDINLDLSKALSGEILLQVESKGEAWYVSPTDNKRYYLGNPESALKVLSEI